MSNGGTCQSPALPALVRPPAPPLQPSLDIKPFLPFPLDTAAAVNLFPNFSAVCVVIENHGQQLLMLLGKEKKKPSISKIDAVVGTTPAEVPDAAHCLVLWEQFQWLWPDDLEDVAAAAQFQNKNMHISWPQFCNSFMSKKVPELALGREDSKEVGKNFGSLLMEK
ncbi:hypothetical protein EYD10_15014 [Varanus komodoensis]|nr:hypothetical protein EYD10_15014 [Varanus komodoensis]